MNNMEKYTKIFASTFNIEPDTVGELKYQGIESWDSVGHMALIAAIEDEFHIAMEADDIIELSSFRRGIELLKKYKIEM
jgi:acyl carrier protein